MDEVDPTTVDAPDADQGAPAPPQGPIDVQGILAQQGITPISPAQLQAEAAVEAKRNAPIDVPGTLAQQGIRPISPAQLRVEAIQQKADDARRSQYAAPIDVAGTLAQVGIKPVPREAFDEPPERTGLPGAVPGRPGMYGAPAGPPVQMQKLWMPGPTYSIDPDWDKQHPQESLGEPQPGVIDTVTSGIRQMLPVIRKRMAGQVSDRAENLSAAAGASKLVGVGMDVAMAASGGAMLAQPVQTIIGVGKYMGAKYIIDEGLKKYGVAKEYADLISTFGGMLGAAGEIRATIDRKIAEHNATADDLVMKDRVEGIWNTLRQMSEDRAKAEQQAKEAATSGARAAEDQPPAQQPTKQEPIATVTQTEPAVTQTEAAPPVELKTEQQPAAEPLTTLPDQFKPGQTFAPAHGGTLSITKVTPTARGDVFSFEETTKDGVTRRLAMSAAPLAKHLGLPAKQEEQPPTVQQEPPAGAETEPATQPTERPVTTQPAASEKPAPLPPLTGTPQDHFVKPLSKFGQPLVYHETSTDMASDLVQNRNAYEPMLHVANNPHMALGQGSHTGVMVVLDPANLNGKLNLSKPGLQMVYEQGDAEFELRNNTADAVRKAVMAVSVSPETVRAAAEWRKLPEPQRTIAKSAHLDMASWDRVALPAGWTKETGADGSITWRRPGFDTPLDFSGHPRFGAETPPAEERTPEQILEDRELERDLGRGGFDYDEYNRLREQGMSNDDALEELERRITPKPEAAVKSTGFLKNTGELQKYLGKHVTVPDLKVAHAYLPTDMEHWPEPIQDNVLGTGLGLYRRGQDFYLAKVEEGHLIVYGVAKDDFKGKLEHLVISPQFQGKGLSRVLLQARADAGLSAVPSDLKNVSEAGAGAINSFLTKPTPAGEVPEAVTRQPEETTLTEGAPDVETQPAAEPEGQPAVEGGGGVHPAGDQHPGTLEGVPPEDVPGAGEGEPPLQTGVGGGEPDGGTAGAADEGRNGPDGGTPGGVQPVVSPPGRGRPAQPGSAQVDPPSANLDGDFFMTPEEAAAIEAGGSKTKARNNLEAIRTLRKIQTEGRSTATPEEQQALARFVGWGDSEMANGIARNKHDWSGIREELKTLLTPEEFQAALDTMINAHYTRRDIAAAMWDGLRRMGFRPGGSVIEPGMGIGNFFMMMPPELRHGTSRSGVEMDPITGGMARLLYPGSNIIIRPYQETNLPDGFFDSAIGNVPFQGGINIYDPAFRRQPYLTNGLHNYFFAKTMTKLRPGGVMLMITSRGTMDSPTAEPFRKWMAEQGDLLGAIRLPANTFQANAGTAVTVDVLAIRKKVPDSEFAGGKAWTATRPHDIGGGEVMDLNEYYHHHPGMMMGQMKPGTMYRRGYPELDGTFDLDAFVQLLDMLPEDVIPSWDTEGREQAVLADNFPNGAFLKENQFAIHNGQLVQKQGGYMKPIPAKGVKLERAKGLIAIRSAAREVIRTQRMGMGEDAIVAAQKELNKVYDAFVALKLGGKVVGAINSNSNALVFGEDPDWDLLTSLEDWDKKTGVATKRDIFSKRVGERPKPVEHADTGMEALAVSLNELGRLDWDRMHQLTGRTPEQLQEEMAGKIFQNPATRAWETADEYLSGNVRKKLEAAEFAVANGQPHLQGNVEALRGVIPRDLEPGEIDVALGTPWIPTNIFEAFVGEALRAERINIDYVELTGGFAVHEGYNFRDNGTANQMEYGTPYFSGVDLFEMAMNGQAPVAIDTYTDFEGKERRVKNPEETIKAVEKQNRLKDEFSRWLWSDPQRAAPLARKYNDEQNNLKLREFDGSHQTFPGLNRSWLRGGDLDPHQKNAVWRIIQSGNTLLAHTVGAGKTLEMICAVMELKRLGLANKPMIVVPNHLVGQWRSDFLRAYPSAQILVPRKKDFKKENRSKLMTKIATGVYDAVVVGQRAFELLPVSDETFNTFIQRQLDEVNDAIVAMGQGKSANENFNNPSIKQLIRRRTSLAERLKSRTNRAARDNAINFEDLGVDWMLVDEAHAYKNLGYLTMMDRMAGLQNSDANRSVDMLLKSDYLINNHGTNRGVVFATGTPVSNSIAETWTMMRYLMPHYLEQVGMDTFDAWAKTFGRTTTGMEIAPEGGRMMVRTRFADFVNAAELMNMFRVVADIRTKEQLNLPTPAIYKGGPIDIIAQASPALKEFIAGIGERADAVRGGRVDKKVDNMLKISSDARKASLDMRLIDPNARPDPNSKVVMAIAKIAEDYKEFAQYKAAQLVFLDMGTPKAERSSKAPRPGQPAISQPADAEEELPAEEGGDFDFYGAKEEVETDTDTADEATERAAVYGRIKSGLMKAGIPEKEIAFIHEANTDDKKADLFADVNAGRVRVLIGSTEKMGAGMNVQKLLISEHHIDAPWRPSDFEQRVGRIDRQGNDLWDKHKIPVRIYRYQTDGSFDSFMWQTIVSKARPITMLMNGDPSIRRVEELGPVVASYEQAMAISSGSPLIREKIILDQQIQKLEILRGGWLTEQSQVHQKLGTLPTEIKARELHTDKLRQDIATRDSSQDLTVGAETFTGAAIRKEGAAALVAALKKLGPIPTPQPVGARYHGFALTAMPRQAYEWAMEDEAGETFMRLSNPDKSVTYYRVTGSLNNHFIQNLGLKAVSKTLAESLSKDWNTKALKAHHYMYWDNPGLVMDGQAHNYSVSVNYESPTGTINSADHQLRGFEESLESSVAQLGRLEKQAVELTGKAGQPFADQEKLNQMLVRQNELEDLLGENKDDVQALASDDEEEAVDPHSPKERLKRLLADPMAAIEPAWLPQKKVYIRAVTGNALEAKKVGIVNSNFAISKSGTNQDPRWDVVHLPSGTTVARGFREGPQAISFARQIGPLRDWNFKTTDHEEAAVVASTLRDFRYSEDFKTPTETPAESVARLAPSAEITRGPFSDYKPKNSKVPTPETRTGEKGWMEVTVDGKKYAVSGHYMIQGSMKPVTPSTLTEDVVKTTMEGGGKPVEPVGFHQITSRKGNKTETINVIVLSDGTSVDARYFDDINKRFPGAQLLHYSGLTQRGDAYHIIRIDDAAGNRVGAVAPIKTPVPGWLKATMPVFAPQPLALASTGRKEPMLFQREVKGTGPEKGLQFERNGNELTVNREALAAILEPWDSPPTRGAMMPPEYVREAAAHLNATGRTDLATELSLASAGGRSIIVASTHAGAAAYRQTLRHERIHIGQMELFGGMGPLSEEFDNMPEKQIAEQSLTKVGYKPDDIVAEIGAYLADEDFATLGLTDAQAERLWEAYIKELIAMNGADRVGEVIHKLIVPRWRRANYADYTSTAPAKRSGRKAPGLAFAREREGVSGGQVPPVVPDAAETGGEEDDPGTPKGLARISKAIEKFLIATAPTESDFRRNLVAVSRIAPEVDYAAAAAAGYRGYTAAIVLNGIHLMQKALAGTGYSVPDVFRLLQQGRLIGIHQMWLDVADKPYTAWEDNKVLQHVVPEVLNLLGRVEGRGIRTARVDGKLTVVNEGVPRTLVQQTKNLVPMAAERASTEEWDELRNFLSGVFADVAERMQYPLTEDEFDRMRFEPHIMEAIRLYKTHMEQELRAIHEQHEGVLTKHTGTFDTYIPLIAMQPEEEPVDSKGKKRRRKKVVGGAKRGTEFIDRNNPGNYMATGLSQEYDPSMKAFYKSTLQRAYLSAVHHLLKTMEDAGISIPSNTGPSYNTMNLLGEEVPVKHVVKAHPRMIVIPGETPKHIGGVEHKIPEIFYNELAPILEGRDIGSASARNLLRRLSESTAGTAALGFLEAIYHNKNLMGTLVTNIFPLAQMLGKAGIQGVKGDWSNLKSVFAWPTSEEFAKDLVAMGRLGLIPDRYGKVSYSREIAEILDGKHSNKSLTPLLFGPHGIDIIVRRMLYKAITILNPAANPREIVNFVNQAGHYIYGHQSGIERWMRDTGVGNWVAAGHAGIRRGSNLLLGSGPHPSKSPLWRWKKLLTSGLVGALFAWILLYKKATGVYPMGDPNAEFGYIPWKRPGGGLERDLWDKVFPGRAEVLINIFSLHPDIMRGTRAYGLQKGFETKNRGGNWVQAISEGSAEMLNTWTEPGLGPLGRGLIAGGTTMEPAIQGMFDDRGRPRPQFWPAVPDNIYRWNAPGLHPPNPLAGKTNPFTGKPFNKTFPLVPSYSLSGVPSLLAWRAKAAGHEINKTLFDNGPTMLGILPANPKQPAEASGYRMVLDSLLPSSVKNAPNAGKAEQRIERQRKRMER